MMAHGRSTAPLARHRPGELRADFSFGLARRPWLERTAKASGPGDTLRGELAPIAVVAVRRCWTPRPRTCRALLLSTGGHLVGRCRGHRSWDPGRPHGQRVLGLSPNRRRSLQATGLCRERACSPVARSHSHVALGAALPRPAVPGRTCLVWTPRCPPTRPKVNGYARHRCGPSSPNSGRRLGRSSHRPRRSAVAAAASRRKPAPTRPCSQQRPADSHEEEAGRSAGGSHSR